MGKVKKFCFGKMFVKSLISVFLKAEAESNFLVFTALYYFMRRSTILISHFLFLIPKFRKAVWGLVRISINRIEMEEL